VRSTARSSCETSSISIVPARPLRRSTASSARNRSIACSIASVFERPGRRSRRVLIRSSSMSRVVRMASVWQTQGRAVNPSRRAIHRECRNARNSALRSGAARDAQRLKIDRKSGHGPSRTACRRVRRGPGDPAGRPGRRRPVRSAAAYRSATRPAAHDSLRDQTLRAELLLDVCPPTGLGLSDG
jgi:hypothetical protein